MTESVGTCVPEDSLASAVAVMWENDCGSVPIVSNGKPSGIITDRDIAVALTTRNARASEISAAEITCGKLVTCGPKDSVRSVMCKMRKHGIRRIPVVNKKGRLVGLISLADLVNASVKSKGLRKPVLKTLMKISSPYNADDPEAG